MIKRHRVLLIGGSSHAGKSCLGQLISAHLGYDYCATDKLARHPGRPWRSTSDAVPIHVVDHYQSLSANELVTDVLAHYRDNLWPLVQNTVTTRARDISTSQIVVEGSAILPELVVTLGLSNIAAIWLIASNRFFKQRIYEGSRYTTKSAFDKKLIDKFLERTCTYNEWIVNEVKRLGLVSVDVESMSDMDELLGMCLAAFENQDAMGR